MSTTPLEGTIEVPAVTTEAASRTPDHFEEIQAPYVFDDHEIAQMNAALRQNLGEKVTLQNQKKAAMQDFALRIKNRENDIDILVNKLNSGEETRAVRAEVFFDAPRSMKQYFHPGGDFIREERMQPADWQLPMFRKKETGEEVPAIETPKGEQVLQTPRGPITRPLPADVGETSLGNVIDAASAKTEAKQFILDLTKDDWTAKGLTNAFKKAAGNAGWTPVQISTLNTVLKGAADVDAMVDTLRPYTVGAPANPQAPVDTRGEVLPPDHPSEEEQDMAEAQAEVAAERILEHVTEEDKPSEPDFLGN